MHGLGVAPRAASMPAWLEPFVAREFPAPLRTFPDKIIRLGAENWGFRMEGTAQGDSVSDGTRLGQLRVDIGLHVDV